MKMRSFVALALAAAIAIPPTAEAAPGGCLKYGAAGAIAGHMAGHGVMGAVGGCMAGILVRKRAREAAERQRTEDLNRASERGGLPAVQDYQRTAPPLPSDRTTGVNYNNR